MLGAILGILLFLLVLVIVLHLNDRAKRRKIEVELVRSNERLRLATESSKSVGWDWDLPSGRNVGFGDLRTVFGIPSNTFTGQIGDFYRYVHPEDRQRISDAVARARKSRTFFNENYRVVWADGTTRWVASRGNFEYAANGDATRMFGLAVDITESKRAEVALGVSEERFRLAAHVGKMFAYEWDADTDVFKVLGEIPEIFGIKKEEYATGKLMLAKMHPDDRQRLMAEVTGICPEKPQFRIRIRLTRSDGTLIWVEKNGYWVFNEQGRLLRIVGMVIDITESKQSEEIVASVGGRLIEAQEEERRRIARELHDDVSQKLAMLTVGLEELARISPESQTQARNRIGSLLKSAAEMTNDVHALSHRLHTSKLELVGLVGTMKSFCREFAEQRYVEIDFTHSDVPSSLPSQVSLCLYRIMQEGLANAVKHSGVRHFDVRLERVADALQLTIRDPGVGFDPSTTMDYQGLGLISMRERVNLVKGTLSIESKPGEGTQIQVRVPIAARTGGDQKSASA